MKAIMCALNKSPTETSYENIDMREYKCVKISILYVRKIVWLSINIRNYCIFLYLQRDICSVYRIVVIYTLTYSNYV